MATISKGRTFKALHLRQISAWRIAPRPANRRIAGRSSAGAWPLALVVTSIIVGCSGPAERATGPAAATTGPTARLEAVQPLDSPAAPGAGEPNLFVAADGRVYMSWLEPAEPGKEPSASTRSGRFRFRYATLEGDIWSEPRTIAENDLLFVNWADFPSLIALTDGSLAAHWLQRSGPGTYAYDVVVSVSSDGGATWNDPVIPHRDGTLTEHGFVSLIPEPDGGFTAVWLDGRNFADRSSASGEHPGPGPDMTLRSSVFDATGGPGPEGLLDPRICDCCQTSAARVGDELLVVYRDRSDEEIRDIYAVARGVEGWRQPVRVARDDWQIPGCPVNGPAVASHGGNAAVAWFALRDGHPEVKLAFSVDAGRSFGEPILIDSGEPALPGAAAEARTGPRDEGTAEPTGTRRPAADPSEADAGQRRRVPLGRVDVEWLDPDTVVVSWLSGQGPVAELRLLPVGRNGELGELLVVAETRSSRASGFPRLVRAGGRLVVAWTEPTGPGSVHVVTVPIEPI